jgi:hypothetical protein
MLALNAQRCISARTAVTLRGLDPDMAATLNRFAREGISYQAVLSVRVIGGNDNTGDIPNVAGHHQLLDDALVFLPHFDFQSGTLYRARFDPPRDPAFDKCASMSLDIRVTAKSTPAPKVPAVFPSGDQLPENLLRFYVSFSEPMRRGKADTQICILGPDGSPILDILYRAPVELWDREMRCLTVLLDPGRLKRGVGPNSELGPPLKAGHEYTLVVGAGMTDRSGQHLPAAFSKRFRAIEAVREAIHINEWRVLPPGPGTVDPLRLIFPTALDWGVLDNSIRVVNCLGQPLSGHRQLGREERQWTFTPASPWTVGDYRVVASSELEDVCGNDLFGAFDRDIRLDAQPAHLHPQTQSIPFLVS